MSDNSVECTKYNDTMCLKRRVTPGEGSSECAHVVFVVFGDSTQRDETINTIMLGGGK